MRGCARLSGFILGCALTMVIPGVAYSEEPKVRSAVTLDVARDQARLLHDVYTSTLTVIHDHYFHGQRAVVPARALEDVFAEMQRRTGVEARWIAATMRAMNVDHDPETAFEKLAAGKISSGKREVEQIQGGYYRRAVAIPMTGGCVNCHKRCTEPINTQAVRRFGDQHSHQRES